MFRFFRFCTVSIFCFSFLTLRAADIYSVRGAEKEGSLVSKRRVRVEVQAAMVASAGSVKDREGETVTGFMDGFQGRAFLYLGPAIALGVQLEDLSAQDQRTEKIVPIKRKMWAALVQWTLTPETVPQLYVLAGAGRARYRTHFPLARTNLDANSSVWLVGVGANLRIWQALYLLGEYQFQYDTKRWDNFVLTGPLVRHHFSAGISYRF